MSSLQGKRIRLITMTATMMACGPACMELESALHMRSPKTLRQKNGHTMPSKHFGFSKQ
ncbi:MAG TPA: hypothetical protein DCR61_14415 [Verrucomicrobiales bacterium]|nr:hypothetical protein [Verrucomicrobiales bacterium]